MRAFLREILITLITAVIIFILLRFTVQDYIIIYNCMEPSFQEGQRVLVNKVVYYFREPQMGDVIVFWPPFDSKEPFIKRIIGLPGESVEIKQGTVYIYKNGNVIELNEPHYVDPPRYTYDKDVIPENEYFVLGDNRNNSNDSHNGWTVPRQNIIGKAWLSIWPPGQWGLAPSYPVEE